MNIKRFIFSFFEVNTYVVWDPATHLAAIVDPAMLSDEEAAALFNFITDNHLRPIHLITTHLHLDHTFGVDAVKARYGLGIEAHAADAFLGRDRDGQARRFNIPLDLPPVEITREILPGEDIVIGEGRLRALSVPGHSPGSIALYDQTDGWVITGDALFKGSIGRTDLAGGDFSTLIRSIRTQLFTLPPDTVVYPGHGDPTTIGAESPRF